MSMQAGAVHVVFPKHLLAAAVGGGQAVLMDPWSGTIQQFSCFSIYSSLILQSQRLPFECPALLKDTSNVGLYAFSYKYSKQNSCHKRKKSKNPEKVITSVRSWVFPPVSVQANARVLLENQSRVSNLDLSKLLLLSAVVSAINSSLQNFGLQ